MFIYSMEALVGVLFEYAALWDQMSRTWQSLLAHANRFWRPRRHCHRGVLMSKARVLNLLIAVTHVRIENNLRYALSSSALNIQRIPSMWCGDDKWTKLNWLSRVTYDPRVWWHYFIGLTPGSGYCITGFAPVSFMPMGGEWWHAVRCKLNEDDFLSVFRISSVAFFGLLNEVSRQFLGVN